MPNQFGVITDHFGYATTYPQLTKVASEETKIALTRTDAQDENGDIAASAYTGNLVQDLRDISTTYALKSGTINLNVFKLGVTATAPTVLVESIAVTTSNAGWPQITLTGKKNIIQITAPTGKLNTYSFPSVTITGAYRAQNLFGAVGTGAKLNGSSFNANVTIAQQDDGLGEPVAHGVSGGTGDTSVDLVAISAVASYIWNFTGFTQFGMTEVQYPNISQGQAAWHTSSSTVNFTLVRDSV